MRHRHFGIKSHNDKAKIYHFSYHIMDSLIAQQLREIYGLNPDSPHPALLLPRLPPMARRVLGAPETPVVARLGDPSVMARAAFDSSQSAFRERADMLIKGDNPVPMGHPLSRKNSEVTMLKAEIERLRKENDQLAKQLKKPTPDQLGI